MPWIAVQEFASPSLTSTDVEIGPAYGLFESEEAAEAWADMHLRDIGKPYFETYRWATTLELKDPSSVGSNPDRAHSGEDQDQGATGDGGLRPEGVD